MLTREAHCILYWEKRHCAKVSNVLDKTHELHWGFFFFITCATYRSRKAILSHQFMEAKWCRIGRLLPWMAHFNLVIHFKTPRGENRWLMFGEAYHKYCFPFKFLIDHRLPWIWGFAHQTFWSDVLSFEALLIMLVVACSNTQPPWV